MALAWLWWRAWFPLPSLSSPLFVWQAWHLEVIDLHSVWQVWHLEKSTFTLCSRRVTYGTGLALGALTSCCRRCCRGCLCGRRGIRKHRPPFCGAGMALGDIDLHFVWQARRFGTGLSGGALGSRCHRSCLCGRPCIWKHRPSLCVAGVVGVALMALAWLWWRAWFRCRRCRCGCLMSGVAFGSH